MFSFVTAVGVCFGDKCFWLYFDAFVLFVVSGEVVFFCVCVPFCLLSLFFFCVCLCVFVCLCRTFACLWVASSRVLFWSFFCVCAVLVSVVCSLWIEWTRRYSEFVLVPQNFSTFLFWECSVLRTVSFQNAFWEQSLVLETTILSFQNSLQDWFVSKSVFIVYLTVKIAFKNVFWCSQNWVSSFEHHLFSE